ncbi:MAG: DNA gyrase modulator, partial [Sulfolobales archaeon]
MIDARYDLDVLREAVRYAESLGASYAEARLHIYYYELLRADNGVLKDYSITRRAGVGVRVIYGRRLGFASTNSLEREDLREAVANAISAAKATQEEVVFADRGFIRGSRSSIYLKDPLLVPPEDKIRVVLETNRAGLGVDGIKSAVTMMGIQRDVRAFISSDADVSWSVTAVGISHTSVAGEAGSMERLHDSRSMVAGWEYIERYDWAGFAREVSETARKALKAT